MDAIASAAIRDRLPNSPSSAISSRTELARNDGQEGAPTPSRFAAAQQLFKRQQTVPPKPPLPPFIPPQTIVPTSPTRVRSFTASSTLYSKIRQSIQVEAIGPEERARAVSSPGIMTFSQSFGQPKPQYVVKPPSTAKSFESGQEAPIDPQCMLPGPRFTNQPFNISAINGKTEMGRAAWWCRHDRLVVFDGLAPEDKSVSSREEKMLLVRASRGLEMSRKNCKKEVIHVEIPCGHCRNILGKEVWKFEARVKRSKVCAGCQERCWREVEKMEKDAEMARADNRRDSFFMQEENGVRRIQSDRNLKEKVGVEIVKTEGPTIVEVTPDLRKVRSDWQLQRTTTGSFEELICKEKAPQQDKLESGG
ncbi:hypothetical protein FKW77_005794 [Venturia effusa]|uniref:Uncharacterized protein n=1 Tax=Venturia effusa TaxID=50376 RepID=A0A517LIU7_9PEZI|nr:hypothetical protein FKW77_005794 [Venturia effusa]